jgi:hypothetical protein
MSAESENGVEIMKMAMKSNGNISENNESNHQPIKSQYQLNVKIVCS